MLPAIVWGIKSIAAEMGGPRYKTPHTTKHKLPKAVFWLVLAAGLIGFEGLVVSLTQTGGTLLRIG